MGTRAIAIGLLAVLSLLTLPGVAMAFDPQPEPPGMAHDLWTAPGQLVGFDPQPEPPGYTPIMQVNLVIK